MIVNLNSKENKVESITINLPAIEFMILHEAIDKYAKERNNEFDKEVANKMLKTIDEMKGESNAK